LTPAPASHRIGGYPINAERDVDTDTHHGALTVEPETRDRVSKRLKRIEGQVRGVERMVDEGRYCPDILTQIASIHAALRGVGKVLMRSHLQHCVTDALRSGDPTAAERTYDEVMDLMYRHVRE
jgi:DNA-binding FrmR family transcriptional regulator